jgi:outer membrane lipoprotein-sorting protein
MRPAEKIEKFLQKASVTSNPNVNKAVLNELTDEMEKTKQTVTSLNIWRILMKSPVTKFAAAAVIIIAVIIGISQFGGSSVVWADVVQKVDQIRTAIYRTKDTMSGLVYVNAGATQEMQGTTYYSSEYGMRMDKSVSENLVIAEYWLPKERTIISINPVAKTYRHLLLSEDEFRRRFYKRDWKEFIKHFMSFEYTNIGREKINGVEVEGIEVTDRRVMPENLFESVVVRLWVDIRTNLPVRVEMKGTAGNGTVQCSQTINVLELDRDVDPNKFVPDIPANYKLIAQAEIDDKDEGLAVQGLRTFSEITGGRYPSSMAILTAVNEVWKARSGKNVSREEIEKGITVQSTCAFYGELERDNKDPAYYGGRVTSNDVNAVLMRWKISDNQYRVIFGNLTSENVSSEQLAELETLLLK